MLYCCYTVTGDGQSESARDDVYPQGWPGGGDKKQWLMHDWDEIPKLHSHILGLREGQIFWHGSNDAAAPRRQRCLECCMLCSLAGVDALCSTTCRSERAGDEERLLCNLQVGLSCTETLPDVPVCHELQVDRRREVSLCTMSGLKHAGPKEGMNVKIEGLESDKLARKAR